MITEIYQLLFLLKFRAINYNFGLTKVGEQTYSFQNFSEHMIVPSKQETRHSDSSVGRRLT